MATIETVPVTTEPDTVVQAEPTIEQDEVVVEPVTDEPPIPKRKPGRPTGSKSKVQGKPRAPRQKKVVVTEAPRTSGAVPEEIPEEIPERVLPNSRPIPTHGYDDRTVMMLAMLQQQADDRKNRKAALYKSWFS